MYRSLKPATTAATSRFPILVLTAALSSLSLTLAADAGEFVNVRVQTDIEARTAVGSFTSARWDHDPQVMIGCQASVTYPVGAVALIYGVCLARDSGGEFGQCVTYDRTLIERIQRIDMRGAIRFSYDENGNCERIETGVYSALLD